jgi:replication fork clamp-binding protein CrfC
MAYFWAIVKAIPAIVTIFSKIEEYVIKPLSKWWKRRQDKKIDDHYKKKQERRDRLNTDIESERKAPNTQESDERLRQLMRKLHNLGERYDKND